MGFCINIQFLLIKIFFKYNKALLALRFMFVQIKKVSFHIITQKYAINAKKMGAS